MKKALILMALPCLLILLCCQRGSKMSEDYKSQVCETLLQLGAKYFEAWENEDLDSVFFFYDKDFLNMYSYGPATNVEENRVGFRNIFDTYSIEGVRYEQVECFVDKEMAFETGLFEQTWITNDKKDTVSFKMRGVSIWRKQEDGSWKMFRLIAQQ